MPVALCAYVTRVSESAAEQGSARTTQHFILWKTVDDDALYSAGLVFLFIFNVFVNMISAEVF